MGRDQLRAVAAQPLGVDLVGRGVVPDAVALVDGGHEGLLAPPGQRQQGEVLAGAHQRQRELVGGGGELHAVRVDPVILLPAKVLADGRLSQRSSNYETCFIAGSEEV